MPSSNRPQKRIGLTLIEVVIGMFLLATLLVTLLSSFDHHRKQIRMAGLRLEAANAVDQLLAEWMSNPQALPINQSGTWNERWAWRTRLVRRTAVHSIPINIVSLEVFESQVEGTPLVALEVADKSPEAFSP